MYEGIKPITEINPVAGGHPDPNATITWALPQVPAAVQEAGDKAFAETIADYNAKGEPYAWIGKKTRKIRADAGKPRPKPQPAPEPEQKAGGITREQAETLRRYNEEVENSLGDLSRAVGALASAEDYHRRLIKERNDFIDSLAK